MDDFENETKSEVKNIIREITESNVGVENYKKHIDKINNTERVIKAQLENFSITFNTINAKLKEKQKTTAYKEALKERYVPVEVFELQQELIRILRDIYSWKSMTAEMNRIFFKKIIVVLNDIEALDIKKDALVEMREMETQRNKNQLEQINVIVGMVTEMVNHKIGMMDDKIINTIKYVEQEMINEKKTLMETFIQAMRLSKNDKREVKNFVEEKEAVSDKSVSKKLKQEVLEPIKPLKKQVYQTLDDIEDDDGDDDKDPFAGDDEDDD